MKRLFLAIAALLLAPAVSFAQQNGKNTNSGVEIWYEGELNVGYGFGGTLSMSGISGDADYGRPFVETVHGVRITPYAFVGGGLGIQYATDKAWKTAMMPIFLNVKGLYPVTKNLAPYVSVDLGYSACLTSSSGELDEMGLDIKGGFYASCGVGLTYKRLNFGLGLQHQGGKLADKETGVGVNASVNSFFLKVGIKF